MKIKTNLYGIVYKNRGKWTRVPYQSKNMNIKSIATETGTVDFWSAFLKKAKKDVKVVRLTLETIN